MEGMNPTLWAALTVGLKSARRAFETAARFIARTVPPKDRMGFNCRLSVMIARRASRGQTEIPPVEEVAERKGTGSIEYEILNLAS
jgi:hypothetical protein